MPGNGRERVFFRFIFQHQKAAVVGVFENLHDSRQVREFFLAVGGHFDFDLCVDRIRGNFRQISIGVLRAKIAAVEIDAIMEIRA